MHKLKLVLNLKKIEIIGLSVEREQNKVHLICSPSLTVFSQFMKADSTDSHII